MLDIKIIREKTEWVKEEIAKLNDSAPIDEVIALDEKRREIIQSEEDLRRQRNISSKEIPVTSLNFSALIRASNFSLN